MLLMAEREGIGGTVPYDFPRRLVNTVKAAEIAGVTKRTIYNWVRRGWVEHVETPSGGVRIYADTLLRHPKNSTI